MKTKTFFLLCLLMGIGLTKPSYAQEHWNVNSNGTGTITGSEVFPYDQVIYRDGIEVDWVYGTVTIHYVDLFKNWNISMVQNQCFGEATSMNFPYEVFKVQDIEKVNTAVDPTVRFFHFNLIGNMGSHYIGYFVWDFTKYDWWDPENVKKMVFAGNNY